MKKNNLFYGIPLGIFIIGIILTVSLVIATYETKLNSNRENFDRQIKQYQLTIEKDIDHNFDQIIELGKVFQLFPNISRNDFKEYTLPIVENNTFIQAIGWNKKVPDRFRSEVEEKAQRDYLNPNLTIIGFDENRMIGKSRKKEYYYPVVYIEPYDEVNSKAILLDVSSDTSRNDTIYKAQISRDLSRTNIIRLVQDNDNPGFLVFYPVFETDNMTLKGVSAGVYRLVDLITTALNELSLYDEFPPSEIMVSENNIIQLILIFNDDNTITSVIDNLNTIDVNHVDDDVIIGKRTILIADKEIDLIFHSRKFGNTEVPLTITLIIPIICLLLIIFSFLLIKHVNNTIDHNLESQYNQTRNQFIDYIFHEIRVPLNTIVIGVENLQKSGTIKRENSKMIDVINSCLDQTKNILNDILDLNKIENGKFDINCDYTNLSGMVDQLVFAFIPTAETKKIKFRFEIDDQLKHLDLMLDKVRITQCINNYLSNAFKYCDREIIFKITTDSEIVEDQPIVVNFIVIDDGCGISDDNIRRLFRPYVQITENKSEIGTGLGLAITKQIAVLHGGTAWVESNMGNWSKFHFNILCQHRRKLIIEEKTINSHMENYSKLKFLVVDDNQMNYFVINEYLKYHKIKTTPARNGEEALKILRKKKFDMILMDRHMPVMDGIEATYRIRNELKLDIPVIALTGMASLDDRKIFMDAGANQVLSKPLDFNLFADIMKQYFPN